MVPGNIFTILIGRVNAFEVIILTLYLNKYMILIYLYDYKLF